MKTPRSKYKPYPSDVSDEEWSFVAPYLALNRADGENRRHDLRAVFNALRWLVRSGASWRVMPHEFPPWPVVYQQMRRWLAAGCFEAMAHDLRALLREYAGRKAQPSAMIMDSRTIQSTPESGARAGYDGAKRRKGAKVHAAVDTLGHLLALHVTPADEQDRAHVQTLAQAVQQITGQAVTLAYADQGYTGNAARQGARPMASNSKWSSTLKPNAASCCCRGAGWWSAASPGRRASGAWHVTMNGLLKLWPVSITLPLLV